MLRVPITVWPSTSTVTPCGIQIFTAPGEKLTEDYVTGRFG